MTRKFLFSVLALTLVACSSNEKRPEGAPTANYPADEIFVSKPLESKVEEQIDLRTLQTSLRMEIPKDVLGYREKKFDTCKVGAGYSSTDRCRKLMLVVVHFQLMCRDSEGTISEAITSANLQPIANHTLKWTLKKASDEILTDSDGYGQIVMVSPYSQRGERMRITSNNDFLVIRAGETRKLIAPQNWCL